MSILPTWPIAAGALVLGLAVGAYADHTVMQGRIDKINARYTEELRVREVQRGRDELAAREKERTLTVRAGEIEQRKNDEIATVRTSADALIARLRQQANSKPTCASGLPKAASTSQATTGTVVSIGDGEAVVRLAERADQLRAALDACYRAYDSIQ